MASTQAIKVESDQKYNLYYEFAPPLPKIWSVVSRGSVKDFADANVEAIDQLDHVHAAPKTAPHPQGPIFTFGVETTPMEGDEDGK